MEYATLITDIFSYSKINDNITHIQAVNLNTLITEIREILAFRLEESNATLTIDHMPLVHGDIIKIKQIFINLLSNAIKFRSQTPLHISIKGKTIGQSVIIRVSDNGIGINEAYHQIIFEPFKRLNPQALYDGSGIGLTIVKRNIEAHNGTIYAACNPSGGTEFVFTLPCVRRA